MRYLTLLLTLALAACANESSPTAGPSGSPFKLVGDVLLDDKLWGDAIVELSRSGAEAVTAVYWDGGEYFEFRGLSPGDYELAVAHPQEIVCFPERKTIHIPTEEPFMIGCFHVASAVIAGTVRLDNRGLGVEGVPVAAWDRLQSTGQRFLVETVTGVGGSYTLHLPHPGYWRTDRGETPTEYDCPKAPGEFSPWVPPDGVVEIDYYCFTLTEVHGTVTLAGNALRDVEVLLEYLSNAGWQITNRTTTGLDGSYSLTPRRIHFAGPFTMTLRVEAPAGVVCPETILGEQDVPATVNIECS